MVNELGFKRWIEADHQRFKQMFDLYFKGKSYEEILTVLTDNPSTIRWLNEPCEEFQIAAVKMNGMVLNYIPNATEYTKRIAIEDSPMAIHWIDNPSEELQMLAVTANPETIMLINNPTENVKLFALLSGGETKEE